MKLVWLSKHKHQVPNIMMSWLAHGYTLLVLTSDAPMLLFWFWYDTGMALTKYCSVSMIFSK